MEGPTGEFRYGARPNGLRSAWVEHHRSEESAGLLPPAGRHRERQGGPQEKTKPRPKPRPKPSYEGKPQDQRWPSGLPLVGAGGSDVSANDQVGETNRTRFSSGLRPHRRQSTRVAHCDPGERDGRPPPAGRHREGQDGPQEKTKPRPSYEGKPKDQRGPRGLPLVGIGSSETHRKERRRTPDHFILFHDHFSIGKCSSHACHACRVGRRQARRGLSRSVCCARSLIVYREGVVAYPDPDRPVIRGAGSDGETRVLRPSEAAHALAAVRNEQRRAPGDAEAQLERVHSAALQVRHKRTRNISWTAGPSPLTDTERQTPLRQAIQSRKMSSMWMRARHARDVR